MSFSDPRTDSSLAPETVPDQKRDSTQAEIKHHLYFEDNDSFFPPTWLGKDPPPRRESESSVSHESEQKHDEGSGKVERGWTSEE
ncbi:hypothetical protein N7474_008708 [Penicillium riverlandense]|uniref:uncharacterized protein n=1 Tax=Penicillium riverlandense TaxID=1903569 RepID=UPI0025494013|nr:uncharacterized protein N7474_008708 [Penicillium riverlandense]KAJ5812407.1 hypothetical protein N7474_008708 [Penicillium riverlandense]